MSLLQVRLRGLRPPEEFRVRRRREDEAVEDNIRIAQSPLDRFDPLREAHLVAVHRLVEEAVRFDEGDVLPLALDQPQNEVRVEVRRLRESDAPPPAQVAQEIEFPSMRVEFILVRPHVVVQIAHEPELAVVQRHGLNGNRPLALQVEERLEEVAPEIDRCNGAKVLVRV